MSIDLGELQRPDSVALRELNGYRFADEILGWNDSQVRDLLVSGQRELSFGESVIVISTSIRGHTLPYQLLVRV